MVNRQAFIEGIRAVTGLLNDHETLAKLSEQEILAIARPFAQALQEFRVSSGEELIELLENMHDRDFEQMMYEAEQRMK